MADYSIYPNAIDGYSQLPLVVDNVTRIDAVTVNRLRSAIINIENELGIEPSSDYETVNERLDALEVLINSFTTTDLALLGYKNPARVATTENVDLSGGATLMVDGVSLENDDRVLVFQQTNASENGIYIVSDAGTGSDGTWNRADDADSADVLLPGTEIFIMEGDTYSLSKFWLITPGPYTLGSTSLEFTEGIHIMSSDSSPTTILTATALSGSAATATETDSISVRSFKEIDFSFTATALDSITEIRARVLYSLLASPGDYSSSPEDWNVLLAEEISSGVATVDFYTISFDVSTYLTSTPGSFGFRAPVTGLHMMVLIWAEAGTPTSSSFVGRALRRS